jgi:hypothetical protein
LAGWSLWPALEGEGTGVDRWPLRKFPLLVDSERNIVETSIIEYLQLAHPGPVRQCVCWRGDSDIPGHRIDPSETAQLDVRHPPDTFVDFRA